MSKKSTAPAHTNPVARAASRLSYGSGAHGKSEKAIRCAARRQLKQELRSY